MNIFAFRPFKGKFNLGNSDDIPENQDGTLIGSIKEIKSALTDFSFRVSGGKAQYSVDGGTTWNNLGGGGMRCVKYGTVTGIQQTVSVSGLGFSSANDYVVILDGSGAYNQAIAGMPVISSKSATSFKVENSINPTAVPVTCSYQILTNLT